MDPVVQTRPLAVCPASFGSALVSAAGFTLRNLCSQEARWPPTTSGGPPQQTKTALEKESPSFPNISKGAPELGSLSCLGHMPNAEPISGK